MKHRIAICVGLTALGVAAATSAQAQAVYVEPPRGYVAAPPPMVHGGLPPNEILMVVRASGLVPLTQPARRGPQYVLLASDNMGGQLRVVVSAHNGRILHAAPAYDPRFAYHPVRPRGLVPIPPPHHGAAPSHSVAPGPDLKNPSPPLPRTARTTPQAPVAGASQNHGLASAPDTASATPSRPARTPMPRPRPAVASNETAAPTPAPQAVRETSPEAERPAATPAPAAPSAAPARPAPTQMVPVAPLD